MSGPIEDRTSVLPCTCLAVLKEDKGPFRSFINLLKKDPWVKCPCPCPFACVKLYYDQCPDKDGRGRIEEGQDIVGVTISRIDDLRFWRAVNFCKDLNLRHFTLLPLGKFSSYLSYFVDFSFLIMQV